MQATGVPLSTAPVGLSLLSNLEALSVGFSVFDFCLLVEISYCEVCLVWQKRNCDAAQFDETHKVNNSLRKFEIVACYFINGKDVYKVLEMNLTSVPDGVERLVQLKQLCVSSLAQECVRRQL